MHTKVLFVSQNTSFLPKIKKYRRNGGKYARTEKTETEKNYPEPPPPPAPLIPLKFVRSLIPPRKFHIKERVTEVSIIAN